MDWVAGIVVYLLLWWLLFMVSLPFGVTPLAKPAKGHEPSAPSKPMLWRKALAASVLALVAWFGVDWLIGSGLFTFRGAAAG